MRILSVDIQSDDGVANMAISEAADRLQELHDTNAMLNDLTDSRLQTIDALKLRLQGLTAKHGIDGRTTGLEATDANNIVLQMKQEKIECGSIKTKVRFKGNLNPYEILFIWSAFNKAISPLMVESCGCTKDEEQAMNINLPSAADYEAGE